MGITEFVAGVERLLSRARDLFPEGGASEQLAASVTGGSVPAAPSSVSGLRSGVSGVAASYQEAQVTAAGLDEQVRLAAVEAGACGQQGRVAAGMIRDQARLVGAAAGPMASSPAGVRLIVATLDQHLAAMQGQLESTRGDYQAVSETLRQTAAGYRRLPGKRPGTDAIPLGKDSPQDSGKPGWVVGDPRHVPWVAGPGGPNPPGPPDGPRWIEIGPGSGTFVRADEIPGVVIKRPGELAPSPGYDNSGNPYTWIELAPHSGVFAPSTDFPDARLMGPNSLGPPGASEYLPGSGIWVPHDSLIPEPLRPPAARGEIRPRG